MVPATVAECSESLELSFRMRAAPSIASLSNSSESFRRALVGLFFKDSIAVFASHYFSGLTLPRAAGAVKFLFSTQSADDADSTSSITQTDF